MSRDGSGTYTRPNNSFTQPVTGTAISSTHADAFFDDLETELTDSLSRSGKGGMSADLDMNNNDINEIKTAVFQGSTSGNTTVQATAIAGTTTLTLPAATDTLVAKATTDTLTNKSISGATNTVALDALASQAAYTLVANNSGSSARPTAVDIAAVTTKASPAAGDYILISDQAASGAFKKATVASVSTAGSVASLNGQTGAVTAFFPPQGRLTLATATPVMTASQSAKTTIYYTPYIGNLVLIYDGTNMVPTVFSELSQATTDSTKSPAAVTTNTLYDLFVWNDAGTLRCTRGPAWSASTAGASSRGTGAGTTELVRVNGVYLNANSITNGPAAQRGTYVGTVRTNGSSQVDYIFGASASGGTAGVLHVWNMYNRVFTGTTVIDSQATYAYTSSTVRQAAGSAGNQVSFVVGLIEDSVNFSYTSGYSCTNVTGTKVKGGVGFNVTNAFSREPFYLRQPQGTNAFEGAGSSAGLWLPSTAGYNYIAAVESNPDNTSSNFFNLNSTAALSVGVWN